VGAVGETAGREVAVEGAVVVGEDAVLREEAVAGRGSKSVIGAVPVGEAADREVAFEEAPDREVAVEGAAGAASPSPSSSSSMAGGRGGRGGPKPAVAIGTDAFAG
jgi:hypothetical protein